MTDFNDLALAKKFHKEHPDLFTDKQINWIVKNRKDNGLDNAGVVLKISNKLYLKKQAFLDWFLNQKP